jgi:signal transduction histidine kinase
MDNDGRRLLLEVIDDGVGFPDAEPDDADDRSASSLGLTIVRTLVGELGGTLAVKSEGGTAFELTIPLDVAREATSP